MYLKVKKRKKKLISGDQNESTVYLQEGSTGWKGTQGSLWGYYVLCFDLIVSLYIL